MNESLDAFLAEDKYVDFSAENIREKAEELFAGLETDTEKARAAYFFVRDEIPHVFDIHADQKPAAKASEVLRDGCGICHSKSCLFAAFLRLAGIPVGFCFQQITLAQDDSMGYCIHAYNAAYLENRWVRLDVRGNRNGIDAEFSIENPKVAYTPRAEYDEFFYPGIYAKPQYDTMEMLEKADGLRYIMEHIPDYVNEKPDVCD